MKVKSLTDCTGLGYENFKAGEVRNIEKQTAEVLISFGYAEEIKEPKKGKTEV